MANTLTALIPTLYETIDIVSRELTGFIPSVALDASVARAAVGQQVLVPISPAAAAVDITPGVTSPNQGDQVFTNTPITIQKSRGVPFRWNGEEQRGLNANGPGYNALKNSQIAQAMRTLTNEIEAYVGGFAYPGASRAYGTPGTTPFATDLSATAQLRKILSDNGSPLTDIHVTFDTTAGAQMRTLTQLTKANEAADDTMLRQGVLLDVHGFELRESAGVQHVAPGTAAGYVTNGAVAAGSTVIPVQTGTGTILGGEIVTFAGDPNKYVAVSLAGGNLTINKPGLRTALAGNTAMTVAAAYTGNLAYHRNAIVLATRAPALPTEGDMAEDRTTIVDPRSGLAFEVSMYKQYRQVYYEMAVAYGGAVIKPEHIATLAG